MKDQNCGYCMRGELLDEFGIFICDLDVSSLILFKEQSHPGRCIVAYKDHVSEIVNISDEFITFETGEDRVRIKIAKWGISSTGKDAQEPDGGDKAGDK